MTLNLLRWALALLVLLPLGRAAFAKGSGFLDHWRRYAWLGLSGIGLYNSLQYLALQSSTPINVTLVAAGLPVWMMLVGRLFFGVPIRAWQGAGALLSIVGVLVVLCRGDWHQLAVLRLVIGDLYMILATIAWSFYSWMLMQKVDVPALRADWAAFLLVQVAYGVVFSSAIRRRRMDVCRTPPDCLERHRAGRAGVCGARPGHPGVPLLGRRRRPCGSGHRRFFCEPDTAVCGLAVGGVSRRTAANVPPAGVRTDRRRHRSFGPLKW